MQLRSSGKIHALDVAQTAVLKARSNRTSCTQQSASKLPGAGIEPFKPFQEVFKDGFIPVGCLKDAMMQHGDKYGKNKHEYSLGLSANVSIVRYEEEVAKENRQPMNVEVCFDFCRTVPGMNSFGLAHGRDCYCAPFFKEVPGDSSDCDEVCDGSPVQMCGGTVKSSIFQMHLCADGQDNLADANSAASASKDLVMMESGRLRFIANQMQSLAEEYQQEFGSAGIPGASDFMQQAKQSAGELLQARARGQRVVEALTAKLYESAEMMSVADSSHPEDVRAAEGAVRDLKQLTKQANAEFEVLMDLQKSVSPRVYAYELAPLYYNIMYFVDKQWQEAPTTCSGDLLGKPIVGKTYMECGRICDRRKPDCKGFSYFPGGLCFLMREIHTVTYYSKCEDSSMMDTLDAVSCSVKFSEYEGTSIAPTSSNCKECLRSVTQASECRFAKRTPQRPQGSDKDTVNSKSAAVIEQPWAYTSTHLVKSHFVEGTLLIDSPGVYILEEDVVFDPHTPLFSGISKNDVSFPDPASEKYPQKGGFFLGFFATIAVVTDNVTIDCNHKSLKMSPGFHKRQRFHALIELGSKPFISGQGPPQFANKFLSPGGVASPSNVVIKNCKLGLSSHHGIHGNNNRGVTIQNVQIQDFEVGGIHLNGASNVHIEDADIGPNLQKTFSARLSQSIFLDHLMNTLLPTQPHLSALRNDATVKIRGEEHSIGEVFERLHTHLFTFLTSGTGPMRAVAGDGQALPDGSAVYGIVIHTTGPAAGDFGACPLWKALKQQRMVTGVSMKNINVHDLAVDVDQITRLIVDGTQVMGPAGDVFDWRRNTDSGDRYVGNPLSDAQLAVGAFNRFLKGRSDVDKGALKWYFGAVNIPESVLEWAGRKDVAWAGDGKFKCNGDAMTHENKGAVGLSLSYLADATFENVQVSRLSNVGVVDASSARCVKKNYLGADTRGVALVNSPGVQTTGITVDAGSLSAQGPTGTVKATDVMTT